MNGVKNRIDYLPAILTLLAALISCVFTIIYKYDMTTSMIIILVSAIVFYILGTIVKWIFIKVLIIDMEAEVEKEEAKTAEEENSEVDENASKNEET